MLDNSTIWPEGTLLTRLAGRPQLVLFAILPHGKVLARRGVQLGATGWRMLPDITKKPEGMAQDWKYASGACVKAMYANRQTNMPKLKMLECEPVHTVAVIAPGLENVSDIPRGVTTVAIGSAINLDFTPDYYVASDWSSGSYEMPADVSGTYGILSTNVSDRYDGNWRGVGYYTGPFDRVDGLPYFYPSEGVSTDALCFAVEELKAKRVLLLGVGQPVNQQDRNMNYYWQGIFLQAFCYWYSQIAEIFSCTEGTTVTCGVKLATIEEALTSGIGTVE